MSLDRLDELVVPVLSTVANWLVNGWDNIRASSGYRLLRAAVTDTGLLGPALVLVLLTSCLFAATGGDFGR